MTEPNEESSEAPETTVKYEDLTIAQKHMADKILEAYIPIFSWPRQSGKTTVTRYVIQEMERMDRFR